MDNGTDTGDGDEARLPCVGAMETARLTADVIKIAYLSVLVVAGLVVNMSAFEHLRQNRPRVLAQGTRGQLHFLQTHLNVSDLLVIIVYGCSEVLWLLTYSFRSVDAVCRLMHFGRAFAFYLSSNVIVCVALNRVSALTAPAPMRRTRATVYAAYACAAVCSLPQVYVWMLVEVDICRGPDGRMPAGEPVFRQCVTVWDVRRHAASASPHADEVMRVAALEANVYNGVHLVLVFWTPLVIIMVCYSFVLRAAYAVSQLQSTVQKVTGHKSEYSEQQVPLTKNEVSSAAPVSALKVTRFSDMANKTNWLEPPPNTRLAGNKSTTANATGSSGRTGKQREPGQKRPGRRLHSALRTAFKLTACYVMCYLPYNVMQTLKLLAGDDWYAEYAQGWDALNSLIVCNALVNPFLYGVFTGNGHAIVGTPFTL